MKIMEMEVQQLVDMGFTETQARYALMQVGNNVEQAIERLLSDTLGPIDPPPQPVADSRDVADLWTQPLDPVFEDVGTGTDFGGREDQDLSAALEMSARDQRLGSTQPSGGGPQDTPLVPFSVEAVARDRDLPCGLRNIGNTCYVNSFLQTLLNIDEFRDRILRYQPPSGQTVAAATTPAEPESEQGAASRETEAANASRKQHCIRLAGELRQFFACTLFTMRSCIDPTRLLGELVDERGQKLPIGSQEDVGEFMLKFLERLDEGLRAGSFAEGERIRTASASPTVCEAPQAPEVAATPGFAAEGSTTQDTVGENEKEAQPPPPLQWLFFGQQVQVFSYRDEKASSTVEASANTVSPAASAEPSSSSGLVVSEEKADFLQIFLDVKHKDLYSAWEAACHTQVEYVTPSGSGTQASTETWIERLPKLLSFQLQRVVFDHEKKVQVKLDESFNFDTTLYVDRFLHHNRQAALDAAARVRVLQERREQLQQAQSRFLEYQGRGGLGVADVLALAADCLEENASSASAESAASASTLRLELCNPHMVGAAGLAEASSILGDVQSSGPSAVQLLRSLRASCLAQEASLTAEIDRLSAEITDTHRDLCKHPYELHAIWVHQGIAGSGHYWAYVRDWARDRWIRYDDALVSVVTWEDVQTAAVGQVGSNASAYVLVYVEKDLAVRQSQPVDHASLLKEVQALLPEQLINDIHIDNGRLKEEQAQQEELQAEQELRQHAQAIFQHYAGLIHKWEPQKRTGDRSGNPHDPNMRKYLHDAALLCFNLFLYRLHGEQEVWCHLVAQSVEAQREIRQWKEDEEGRILFHLGTTLRDQKCYASMLRDKPSAGRLQRCELQEIDMVKLTQQYDVILLQAYIVDEAIQNLKEDRSRLIQTIGSLAFVWAKWNLEAEDKFRQNEVLLIMSTLIFNTISLLDKNRQSKPLPEALMGIFLPVCEYFLLLLLAVEWPNTWKSPLINRIYCLCPTLNASKMPRDDPRAERLRKFGGDTTEHRKETILAQPQTQVHYCKKLEELKHIEPSEDFFERHRALYSWLMSSDEAISSDYVYCMAPVLREEIATGRPVAD